MLLPAGDHAKIIYYYYYGSRSVGVQQLCRADDVTDSFIDSQEDRVQGGKKVSQCSYLRGVSIKKHPRMERLLTMFEEADPFSTWWPTIAALTVGIVITVR